jgi:hypothetical protein
MSRPSVHIHQARRCERCAVVLLPDEVANQRYPDRDRCEACDPIVSGTAAWLNNRTIHAPTDDEAHAQWLRRVYLTGAIETAKLRADGFPLARVCA